MEYRMKELLKFAEQNRLCDFIGTEYYAFTKEELRDIIVELACAAFEGTTEEFETETMRDMCDRLKEDWEEPVSE